MNGCRSQRGTSLVEVLVSTLVLSVGVLATTTLQSRLRSGADLSRERGQALQMAQAHVERLRGFTALAGNDSYAGIVSLTGAPEVVGPTSYTLRRQVVEHASAGYKTAQVDIAWSDRAGAAQVVSLDAVLAGQAPSLAGSLGLRRDPQEARGAWGRSATIPVGAKDLGDGRSLWKPSASGTVAYVFENATGRIQGRCLNVSGPTSSLTAGDAQLCGADDAVLLSGIVRMSLAVPPDASSANDASPSMQVTLTLVGQQAPVDCTSEAQKTVAALTASGRQRLAVALDGTPASVGASTWTDLGEHFVTYHCRISRTAAGWSGHSDIVPTGWSLGSTAVDRRVCRYGTEREHPAIHQAVKTSLTEQNFLIVRGDQACPAPRTALHQP